ncbi:CoA transferase [Leucobacter sp. CSA1]|uniref:CoA transferase n=1 Tax=Leucobacter chromiisoli TaxID=2796471 RepID=A0A934QAA9_9MICO|nr:CoA transferase [Leucobacter chromiisoli]MBK0420205.1 CoA transferase [Leucobacter chromiisoli]
MDGDFTEAISLLWCATGAPNTDMDTGTGADPEASRGADMDAAARDAAPLDGAPGDAAYDAAYSDAAAREAALRIMAPTTTGPRTVLPSAFDVTGLATGAVAAATRAVAELHAARSGAPVPPTAVDSREACAAFASERLFRPTGWTLPPLREELTGDYAAADGWIRLHTNYAHHRTAVERVLGARTREDVEQAVSSLPAEELERRIVEAGGAAAVMRDRVDWLASPAGRAASAEPPVRIEAQPVSGEPRWVWRGESASARSGRRGDTGDPGDPGIAGRSRAAFGGAAPPLAGVRVLDLTRVIAGPVCTAVLAAYGAEVLRIDPPGFAEVPSLLPLTTRGKRSAFLDLSDSDDRGVFEGLLSEADVLICGLRPDALGRLGYDDAALESRHPALTVARLDAYGWEGPWSLRRGFDSLVQMSCGIAADGAAAAAGAAAAPYAAAGTAAATGAAPRGGRPVPLPVQALDHASGWLLAAAVVRALTRRLADSTVSRIRASLVGTAELLYALPSPRPNGSGRAADLAAVPLLAVDLAPESATAAIAPDLEPVATAWGPALQAPMPGLIDGIRAGGEGDRRRDGREQAGPLGRHAAVWG